LRVYQTREESSALCLHCDRRAPSPPYLAPAFDPIGAVDVYRRAKEERPDLQLLLIGRVPESSTVAWSRFEQIVRHAQGDPDAHVVVVQEQQSQMLANAAQRAAGLAIQRSVPAGFSLPVWESQ
jgi:trehalose synthase